MIELDDIQGNVLQGYGFPHAAFVNVRVHGAEPARDLIRELLGRVTSASPWPAGKPPTTLNLALSHHGLRALGVSERVLATFPPEFVDGMAARADRLGDTGRSAPERWEPGLGAIDLLVMMHAREEAVLERDLHRLAARGEQLGLACDHVQRGHALLGDSGAEREHFGYRDGFSQPGIEGAPGRADRGQGVPLPKRRLGPLPLPGRPRWRPLAVGEFILGYRDEDDVVPPAPAMPFARNGTFMVYRKLAQDVPAFRRLVSAVARRHYDCDDELAAAKLVGRWRDGTPLMLQPSAGLQRERAALNDFRYERDPDGIRCPVGAHIRRANPRDSLPGGGDRTRRHRILRRGMPYGPELPLHAPRGDAAERGLVFVCFNASISRQFEVVNRWLLDGQAFGLGRDGDLLTSARARIVTGKMTIADSSPQFLPRTALVWTRGGEYLFVPSLSALGALAEAP